MASVEEVKWQVGVKNGRFTDPLDRRVDALDQLEARLRRSTGPFDARIRGDQWKRNLTRQQVIGLASRWSARPDFHRAGPSIQVKTAKGRVLVMRTCAVYVKLPPIPDPLAVPQVKRAWNILQAMMLEEAPKGTQFVYLGIFNCRRIDNSTLWSQHARRRALDWVVLNRDGSIAEGFMRRMVSRLNAEGFTCETLWKVSGHFYHAHVGACPPIYTFPPCAG